MAASATLSGCGVSGDTPEQQVEVQAAPVEAAAPAFEAAHAACAADFDAMLRMELPDTDWTSADYIVLGDGGESLTVTQPIGGEYATALSVAAGQCVLTETDAPDSVVNEVEQTTALMGRQEASWDDTQLSYSYHPDSGFAATFTAGD